MSTPPRVAVYGHNQTLLDTRQWVLEHAGYRVVVARALEEVRQANTSADLALLVLCHTLSPQEREIAVSYAEAQRPLLPNLSLTASAQDGDPEERREVCSLFDGPRAMIRSVKRLTAERE